MHDTIPQPSVTLSTGQCLVDDALLRHLDAAVRRDRAAGASMGALAFAYRVALVRIAGHADAPLCHEIVKDRQPLALVAYGPPMDCTATYAAHSDALIGGCSIPAMVAYFGGAIRDLHEMTDVPSKRAELVRIGDALLALADDPRWFPATF